MELRCYSYDGGAPPMDSWPQEEKTGVTSRQHSRGPIKAIRPLWLVFALGYGYVPGWTCTAEVRQASFRLASV